MCDFLSDNAQSEAKLHTSLTRAGSLSMATKPSPSGIVLKTV